MAKKLASVALWTIFAGMAKRQLQTNIINGLSDRQNRQKTAHFYTVDRTWFVTLDGAVKADYREFCVRVCVCARVCICVCVSVRLCISRFNRDALLDLFRTVGLVCWTLPLDEATSLCFAFL